MVKKKKKKWFHFCSIDIVMAWDKEWVHKKKYLKISAVYAFLWICQLPEKYYRCLTNTAKSLACPVRNKGCSSLVLLNLWCGWVYSYITTLLSAALNHSWYNCLPSSLRPTQTWAGERRVTLKWTDWVTPLGTRAACLHGTHPLCPS